MRAELTLEAADADVVLNAGFHRLSCSLAACCRREVGQFVIQSDRADIAAIVYSLRTFGGVEQEVHFAVFQEVHDGAATFVDFVDDLAVDAVFAQERSGAAGREDFEAVYPHPIDLNVLPHIDVFTPNGYTKEEMKMINETRKILSQPELKITATTVRIPTMGGHSESVNVELGSAYDLEDVRQMLASTPGVIVQDDPSQLLYPMPLTAHDKDEVFVGRIRRDESLQNGLNFWVVADNLRKGAATNAVQIAQSILAKDWFA